MDIETLDSLDKQILNKLQKEFPLVAQPFKVIAKELNTNEENVLTRIQNMKGSLIRQISAIFDTKSLGYESSLVAAKIKPGFIDEAAAVINEHPCVSHNYARNHEFNLWFTIAVPPHSKLGLKETVQILGELAPGVESIRLLPTLKLFKIGVYFDMEKAVSKDKEKPVYNEDSMKAVNQEISEKERLMIRELQKDLPIIANPFEEWAQNASVSVEQLLKTAEKFIELGQMRRFAALLHHRKAGFKANGMGIWAVPNDMVEEIGAKMASFKAVSHCYKRPTYPDWPYNIFTMVHGKDREECETVLQAIEDEVGIKDRDVLYSSKQYRKIRLPYFTPEVDEWEQRVIERGKHFRCDKVH
ncbi:MAG TPA: Lrp/AsnC family transcriptional regulator [Bacillus bacterium]|nr:Lrp/AsnC family transcriptional regulator [Bacillus sp. (in: firmicutes)]